MSLSPSGVQGGGGGGSLATRMHLLAAVNIRQFPNILHGSHFPSHPPCCSSSHPVSIGLLYWVQVTGPSLLCPPNSPDRSQGREQYVDMAHGEIEAWAGPDAQD